MAPLSVAQTLLMVLVMPSRRNVTFWGAEKLELWLVFRFLNYGVLGSCLLIDFGRHGGCLRGGGQEGKSEPKLLFRTLYWSIN